jgi:hypothetical protein
MDSEIEKEQAAGDKGYLFLFYKTISDPWVCHIGAVVLFIMAYAQYLVINPDDAWNIAFYLLTGIGLIFEGTRKIALLALGLAVLFILLRLLFHVLLEQSILVAVSLGLICIFYAVKIKA